MLCLDRVLIQAMLTRPVVAAPLIGLILDDPYTGLVVGALLELFWIDRVPIGAYIPPNDTLAAILISASTIMAGQNLGELPPSLIGLAVLILLPLGILAQRLDLSIVRSNENLARAALVHVEACDDKAVSRHHLKAIARVWLLSTGFILLALPLSVLALTWVYPRLSEWTVRALTLVYGSIPLIGAAVVLNTIRLRGAVPVVCAVFLLATVFIAWIREM